MLYLVLLCGALHAIGGRHLLGSWTYKEKMLFRVIIPSLLVSYAFISEGGTLLAAVYVLAVVLIGSLAAFSSSVSYEEITGEERHSQYHPFIRNIGYKVFPANRRSPADEYNRRRGALMKGIHYSLRDYPTFVFLSAINPIALLLGFACLLTGLVYYAIGKLIPTERYDISAGDFMYGTSRWFLIIYSLNILF